MKIAIVLSCFLFAAALLAAGAPAAQAQVDNYQCYKVKDIKNPAKFAKRKGIDILVDQFGVTIPNVNKIAYVCNPTDLNGSGVINPTVHLICYKTSKGLKFSKPRPTYEVSTQFQLNQVQPIKAQLLCLPGTKTSVP